jgi:fucose permease
MFAAFFLSALYLQQVLRYSPLEVGLAYLPSTLIWGAVSLGISDKLVLRFGIKLPMVTGLSLFAVGILLFARAPTGPSPSMFFRACSFRGSAPASRSTRCCSPP